MPIVKVSSYFTDGESLDFHQEEIHSFEMERKSKIRSTNFAQSSRPCGVKKWQAFDCR